MTNLSRQIFNRTGCISAVLPKNGGLSPFSFPGEGEGQGMRMSTDRGSVKLLPRRGFTLIELLAVIAVIAVLAGLIIGIFPMVNQGKIRSRANAEMAGLTAMIESYKAKKGFYPIDNRKDLVTVNPPLTNIPTTLYHELTSEAPVAPNDSVFVANSGNEARNFARALKEGQVRTLEGFKLLGIPAKGPDGDFSYWRYDCSSTNRHHQEGFDLWIDVFIKGEKHTFKNWNE